MSIETTDAEIFEKGTPVLMIDGPRSATIEDWVQSIAKRTQTRTDWRLVGGRAIVLVLGDRLAQLEVIAACFKFWDELVLEYLTCKENFCAKPAQNDVQWSML